MTHKPRYTHDCDVCRFVGPYNTFDRDYDLWHCPQTSLGGSIILRRSSRPDDYMSAPVKVIDYSADPTGLLWAGLRLARKRGFVSPKTS